MWLLVLYWIEQYLVEDLDWVWKLGIGRLDFMVCVVLVVNFGKKSGIFGREGQDIRYLVLRRRGIFGFLGLKSLFIRVYIYLCVSIWVGVFEGIQRCAIQECICVCMLYGFLGVRGLVSEGYQFSRFCKKVYMYWCIFLGWFCGIQCFVFGKMWVFSRFGIKRLLMVFISFCFKQGFFFFYSSSVGVVSFWDFRGKFLWLRQIGRKMVVFGFCFYNFFDFLF